ncbi:MAG TPA: ribbon-helix-helix protein, CopG family [Candidatus Obscuribacterales bacterium]
MPKGSRNRKYVTLAFEPKDYLRIEQLAKAKKVTKADLMRDAILHYLTEHDRIIHRDRQAEQDGPVAEEVKLLREQVLRALRDLTFSVGQNIHLTGTMLTESLPAEIQAMPAEEWNKLWDESKRYAYNYMKLVSEGLSRQPEEDEGDEQDE